jgi:nitrite reductase/ring-hydroxylating ferredoxin subunit
MPRFRSVGSLADFPEGRGVAVRVEDRRIAVFRIGGVVFAIEDACPHRGFPLNDGTVTGLTVRCRTHGSCFNLASGALERGPAAHSIRTYRAVIVGDHVEVDLGECT